MGMPQLREGFPSSPGKTVGSFSFLLRRLQEGMAGGEIRRARQGRPVLAIARNDQNKEVGRERKSC